jgi:hypothetical protein
MPRVSLPSSIKNLKTFEVLLTQTTEDHLRSHCQTFFANFEAKKDKYMSRISDAVGIFLDGNPYTDRNWKKHEPTRHYKDMITWFGEDEADVQEYMGFQFFLSDLNLIAKNFNWEELDDMKWEVERFMTHMYSGQKDLAQLEEMRFIQAKKKFEEENKDWIEEQALIKLHKSSHHTGHYWRVTLEEEGDMTDCFACKFCKEDCDQEVQKFKEIREYEAKQRELYAEFYKPKTVVKEKKVEEPYVRSPEQICEDCGFKSHYASTFEAHKNEPMHKRVIQLKSWYCDDCKVQCQCQVKYDEHLESTKHKKNIGEIVKPDYVCEKCDYKTKLKQHYEQHCTTNKHLEKSSNN